MAVTPPNPRFWPNGGLFLADLRRLAEAFDELSGEQLWPAADFIEFVRLEMSGGANLRDELHHERHAEYMRRWRQGRVRTPIRTP